MDNCKHEKTEEKTVKGKKNKKSYVQLICTDCKQKIKSSMKGK